MADSKDKDAEFSAFAPKPPKPPKDFWDILQILSSLFIPIAGLVVGHWLSVQQKQANEMKAQADRLSLLIRHLASENSRERRIAVDVSKYLASHNQLPAEIVPSIITVADSDSGADVAKAASQVLANIEKNNRMEAVEIRQSAQNVAPRLYVHINSEQQRGMAEALTRSVMDSSAATGLRVPSITQVEGPRAPQLRYFKKDERAEAESIALQLAAFGVTVAVEDYSTLVPNADQIRPRHFELWLGEYGVRETKN